MNRSFKFLSVILAALLGILTFGVVVSVLDKGKAVSSLRLSGVSVAYRRTKASALRHLSSDVLGDQFVFPIASAEIDGDSSGRNRAPLKSNITTNLARLNSVEKLVVKNLILDDDFFTAISQMRIRELWIENCDLTNNEFKSPDGLWMVSISRSSLNEKHLASLSSANSLVEVWLENMNLSEALLGRLELPLLETLSVKGTNVNSTFLEIRTGCPNLETIFVSSDSFSVEAENSFELSTGIRLIQSNFEDK